MINFLKEYSNYKASLKNRIGNPSIEISYGNGQYYDNSWMGGYSISEYPSVFLIAKNNSAQVALKFETGDDIILHKECFKR